jgi:hypothetical protein
MIFKVTNKLENRNTNSRGAQRRAPPKAGHLLVLRVSKIYREFEK